jgi:HK97 family phage portal protein
MSLEEFGALIGTNAGFGKSKAGIDITPRRAMGITAWYSGVRYLKEGVGFLPIHSYLRDTTGRSRVANPVWLDQPDSDMTRGTLFELWIQSLLNRGVALGFKLRDPLGERVTGMRFLHPNRVKIRIDQGRRVFDIRTDNDGVRTFTSRDVFCVVFQTEDGYTPISPISYHRESLSTIAAAEEFAGRAFGDGTHVDKYVEIDSASRQKPKEVKEELEEFYKGLDKAHGLPVLKGMSLKTVGLSPEDAQLLLTRQYGIIQVAQILRIPPHKLYDLSRATFSNIEHQAIESVVDSIRPLANRFEDAINADRDLIREGRYVEFQLEGLLRGDIKSRYEAYGIGIEKGFLTRNEPRTLENLPAIPGLDRPLVPLNMAEVGSGDPTLAARVTAAGVLVRSGFVAEAALEAVGLDPIEHLGLLPTTLQTPKE